MQQKEDAVIQVKDLYKVYRMGEEKVYALNGVSFEIHRGEFCAIKHAGRSGTSDKGRDRDRRKTYRKVE